MAQRHGDRAGRAKKKTPASPKRRVRSRVHHDPMFGEIPLISVSRTDSAGRSYEVLEHDPDYQPPLPRGAVRGDVRRQQFCGMCHVPKYFFIDLKAKCLGCGQEFLFGANEQKYWYETLKFHPNSVPTRCPSCRKKRRSARQLRIEIARARTELEKQPGDPGLLIALASAIVRYRQVCGEGDLAEAISAARKAIRRCPEAVEALYWEGKAQLLAGRRAKAFESLQDFINSSDQARCLAPLRKDARRHCTELAMDDSASNP
jgi:hypothetical protein